MRVLWRTSVKHVTGLHVVCCASFEGGLVVASVSDTFRYVLQVVRVPCVVSVVVEVRLWGCSEL